MEPFGGMGDLIELQEGDHKSISVKRISVESMEAALRRSGK